MPPAMVRMPGMRSPSPSRFDCSGLANPYWPSTT